MKHPKKTAHFVMQGKGGCGKSLIATSLAQYLGAASDGQTLCVDTDPVNRTFSRYRALAVQGLELLDDTRQINARQFDTLIEWLLAHPGDSVIDNGASGFVPLMAYLSRSGAVDLLRDYGIDVVLHVPIIGGDALEDTANGFGALMAETSADAVVWINPFFGAVTRNGKAFVDSALYADNVGRIRGVVTLQDWDRATYGQDLADMRAAGLTFSQAIDGDHFGAMPRHRLSRVWADLYTQLAAIRLMPLLQGDAA